MDFNRLAILGIGSVRCGHPIIASLASYFGERKLEVALYDADSERLELYRRLADTMFKFNKCTHELESFENATEAVENADCVILAISDNCARKLIRKTEFNVDEKQRIVESLLEPLGQNIAVLSLLGSEFILDRSNTWNQSWPPEPTPADRASTPHQILRFIHGEEYPYEWLKEFDRSPIKLWLDNPANLPQVDLEH